MDSAGAIPSTRHDLLGHPIASWDLHPSCRSCLYKLGSGLPASHGLPSSGEHGSTPSFSLLRSAIVGLRPQPIERLLSSAGTGPLTATRSESLLILHPHATRRRGPTWPGQGLRQTILVTSQPPDIVQNGRQGTGMAEQDVQIHPGDYYSLRAQIHGELKGVIKS